jgi:hypothetical protein
MIVRAACALTRGSTDTPISKALTIELQALGLFTTAGKLDPLFKEGLMRFSENRSFTLRALAYLHVFREKVWLNYGFSDVSILLITLLSN